MNARENVESATARLHPPSGRVGNEPKRVPGEGRAKQSGPSPKARPWPWALPKGGLRQTRSCARAFGPILWA
jgi:hypothetical protein